MSKRREFNKSVKAEIFRRATVDGSTHCEACGLAVKKWHYDHINPDALQIDKSKKLTANEGQLLCVDCHAEKTGEDVKKIAKAKRQEAKHIGATLPEGTMQSRPFPKRQKRPKINKAAVDAMAIKRTGGIARQYGE